MGKESEADIGVRLAIEEEEPLSKDELVFADFACNALTPEQKEKCTEMDLITVVRGFQTYKPRDLETAQALKAIMDWRDSIDYYKFITPEGIPGVSREQVEAFHKSWPEKYLGTDKYGHILTYTRVTDIDIPALENFDEDVMIKIIAQKLACFTEYRKRLSVATGVQRYKYSVLLDLKGVGVTSLLSKKGMLTKVTDVAKLYFPETVWRIYTCNTPMMIRTLWSVAKPLLHPITQAKMNFISSVASLATELKENQGFELDQLSEMFGGTAAGIDTLTVVNAIMGGNDVTSLPGSAPLRALQKVGQAGGAVESKVSGAS